MPGHERLVLCGEIAPSEADSSRVLRLCLHGPKPNLRVRIQDISSRLVSNIPDVLVDLLEVATYVYAADSAVPRGGPTDVQFGAQWRRKLRFIIPGRCPDFWSSGPVSSALVETLGFVSEDDYQFEFTSRISRPAVQSYLEFSGENLEGFAPDEVVLFSGGLDSFAGALEELVARGKSVALVSHRSASKIASAQQRLVEQVRCRVGLNRALHIPVWTELDRELSQEPTHRTRSFLFAALGTVTARLFGLDRIRFYENGVVSLNLPPVAQVIGARATRTTHPQALAGFRRVLSELLKHPVDVVNPFVWLTKAEVVERIAAHGFSDLIRDTRSCTRVHDMTRLHPHCGQCSQCLDRRFAILEAGQAHEDPDEAYKVDLFTGERPAGPDREMALAYVRSASDVNRMADVAFFSRFGEASRAVGFSDEPAGVVAERIFDLHRRRAAAVCTVFDQAVSKHAGALREQSLPASSLLALVVGQRKQKEGPHAADPAPRVEAEPGHRAPQEIRIVLRAGEERIVFE